MTNNYLCVLVLLDQQRVRDCQIIIINCNTFPRDCLKGERGGEGEKQVERKKNRGRGERGQSY